MWNLRPEVVCQHLNTYSYVLFLILCSMAYLMHGWAMPCFHLLWIWRSFSPVPSRASCDLCYIHISALRILAWSGLPLKQMILHHLSTSYKVAINSPNHNMFMTVEIRSPQYTPNLSLAWYASQAINAERMPLWWKGCCKEHCQQREHQQFILGCQTTVKYECTMISEINVPFWHHLWCAGIIFWRPCASLRPT